MSYGRGYGLKMLYQQLDAGRRKVIADEQEAERQRLIREDEKRRAAAKKHSGIMGQNQLLGAAIGAAANYFLPGGGTAAAALTGAQYGMAGAGLLNSFFPNLRGSEPASDNPYYQPADQTQAALDAGLMAGQAWTNYEAKIGEQNAARFTKAINKEYLNNIRNLDSSQDPMSANDFIKGSVAAGMYDSVSGVEMPVAPVLSTGGVRLEDYLGGTFTQDKAQEVLDGLYIQHSLETVPVLQQLKGQTAERVTEVQLDMFRAEGGYAQAIKSLDQYRRLDPMHPEAESLRVENPWLSKLDDLPPQGKAMVYEQLLKTQQDAYKLKAERAAELGDASAEKTQAEVKLRTANTLKLLGQLQSDEKGISVVPGSPHSKLYQLIQDGASQEKLFAEAYLAAGYPNDPMFTRVMKNWSDTEATDAVLREYKAKGLGSVETSAIGNEAVADEVAGAVEEARPSVKKEAEDINTSTVLASTSGPSSATTNRKRYEEVAKETPSKDPRIKKLREQQAEAHKNGDHKKFTVLQEQIDKLNANSNSTGPTLFGAVESAADTATKVTGTVAEGLTGDGIPENVKELSDEQLAAETQSTVELIEKLLNTESPASLPYNITPLQQKVRVLKAEQKRREKAPVEKAPVEEEAHNQPDPNFSNYESAQLDKQVAETAQAHQKRIVEDSKEPGLAKLYYQEFTDYLGGAWDKTKEVAGQAEEAFVEGAGKFGKELGDRATAGVNEQAFPNDSLRPAKVKDPNSVPEQTNPDPANSAGVPEEPPTPVVDTAEDFQPQSRQDVQQRLEVLAKEHSVPLDIAKIIIEVESSGGSVAPGNPFQIKKAAFEDQMGREWKGENDRDNMTAGMLHVKELIAKNPQASVEEIYLHHFFGSTGANRFREALNKNPDTPLNEAVSQAALKANREFLQSFKNDNGKFTSQLTVGEFWEKMKERIAVKAKDAGVEYTPALTMRERYSSFPRMSAEQFKGLQDYRAKADKILKKPKAMEKSLSELGVYDPSAGNHSELMDRADKNLISKAFKERDKILNSIELKKLRIKILNALRTNAKNPGDEVSTLQVYGPLFNNAVSILEGKSGDPDKTDPRTVMQAVNNVKKLAPILTKELAETSS